MLTWSVPNLSYSLWNSRWKVARKVHLSAKSTLVYSSALQFLYPHGKISVCSMRATTFPPQSLNSEFSHSRGFSVGVLIAKKLYYKKKKKTKPRLRSELKILISFASTVRKYILLSTLSVSACEQCVKQVNLL